MKQNRRRWMRAAVAAIWVLCGAHVAVAQIATGTVAGTVKDAQGGVMPGATVALISATRGTTSNVVTNQAGDFTFPNVPGDTYTVKVTMSGFKTVERANVGVSPGDRVVVGTITVDIGGLNEVVTVSDEAPLLQAQSGERSFAVSRQAVESLPISGRNWSTLTALSPGIVNGQRLGSPGANNSNVMLDGVAIMDTGNNGQMLQTNVEAIAEVKVLTSGYQAEYGRASGAQITAVTKSGSNRFHGSVYDVLRNSKWDTNSWANQKNGIAKSRSVQKDYGFTVGGPVGKPGGNNKLFFFYSHEMRPRTSGGAVSDFRVPTLLERQGDFSQTTDNNGAPFPFIKDPLLAGACSASNQTACFKDGGVVGRIPKNRLYPVGLNILNLWPDPNITGLNFNYEVKAPLDSRLTQQPTGRVDYQASTNLRFTAKYTGQIGTVKPTAGSIPGFNDTLQKYPFIYQPSTTVNYTVNPTTFLEATYGYIQNQLGTPIISPASNRCNVGLCDFPLLFPDAGLIDTSLYNYSVLQAINSPMLVDNRIMLPPTFSWGSRIANAPPSQLYPGFLNLNRTHNVVVSATKLHGPHTLKAGFYYFSAYKAENNLSSASPFNGVVNFQNDTNNPLDTGFGYSNAALGVFSQFLQQSKFVQGEYRYKNIEWFAQDNWKFNSRLTFDYGLRFTHATPQYDTRQQASNFFLDKWSAAAAPVLYRPGCLVATNPCPSASRVAINPKTGQSLGTGSALAIGTIVANSGNLTNGVIQAGQGIAKENYVWPSLRVAPRVGAAYDLMGNQKVILRGNFGMFIDRPEGNMTSNQIGNPPYSVATTVRFGTLQSLGSGGLATTAPPSLVIFNYDATQPVSLQWSAGMQMSLPWASSLDVSYVASHGYDLMNPFNQSIDINAPDLGAAYLAANQDPTLAAASNGSSAFSTDLLRPYQGFGAIGLQSNRFWSTFHSIQTSFNRRFRDGLQFGLNYTLTLDQRGTNTLNANTGVRLKHNPDGTYVDDPTWAEARKLFSNNGLRRHLIKGSFVWSLPNVWSDAAGVKRVVGLVTNDWQLSGILTAGSANRYDIGYQYANGGANVNLTGSPNYAARTVITGATGSGCSGDQYRQFTTSSFAGPLPGSNGLESGLNTMGGCPDHTLDLTVQRTFRLGGARTFQVRADAFNALNVVVYSGRQSTMQMTSPTSQGLTNSQFLADGSLDPARLQPRNAGFGAVNGAQSMRSMQVQVRFGF
ncbi:MAG: carboxypeptidase-like regulatory domain-containing protein [Acidobacteriota bacterium]